MSDGLKRNDTPTPMAGRPEPPKGPFLSRKVLAIVLVVVIGVAAVAGSIISLTLGKGEQRLFDVGDEFDYVATGVVDGDPFTANVTFNVWCTNEQGTRWTGWMVSSMTTPRVSEILPDSYKAYVDRDEPLPGDLIKSGTLDTVLGPKTVLTVCNYDFERKEVTLCDFGVESRIVYRWAFSSVISGYNFTMELKATNNTHIAHIDLGPPPTVVFRGLNRPSTEPMGIQFGWFEPGTGGGMMFASVQMVSGECFHYVTRGAVWAIVYDIPGLMEFERTGCLRFRGDLSRAASNPGETNVTVLGGTYWVIIQYRGSETSFMYDGMQLGGLSMVYFR